MARNKTFLGIFYIFLHLGLARKIPPSLFESDRKLSSVWVAMSGVVGAHLVPGGEHLATAPARELPGLVDVLEMSLHAEFLLLGVLHFFLSLFGLVL